MLILTLSKKNVNPISSSDVEHENIVALEAKNNHFPS